MPTVVSVHILNRGQSCERPVGKVPSPSRTGEKMSKLFLPTVNRSVLCWPSASLENTSILPPTCRTIIEQTLHATFIISWTLPYMIEHNKQKRWKHSPFLEVGVSPKPCVLKPAERMEKHIMDPWNEKTRTIHEKCNRSDFTIIEWGENIQA